MRMGTFFSFLQKKLFFSKNGQYFPTKKPQKSGLPTGFKNGHPLDRKQKFFLGWPKRVGLTLVAQMKQVVTTLATAFMRFLVSWMTLSTLLKVAALPTVGDLMVKFSCWQYTGNLSRLESRSFFGEPGGTW